MTCDTQDTGVKGLDDGETVEGPAIIGNGSGEALPPIEEDGEGGEEVEEDTDTFKPPVL